MYESRQREMFVGAKKHCPEMSLPVHSLTAA